ncbi:synaptobrevin like protein YKT6 [Strigomonas culicis]|nr:synaptobrevin like protein YKT6 [Strigomonas culicis]|eukprot:EPY23913.1 synaptobrevin like protein YKT6 [Strigomonas culicis]
MEYSGRVAFTMLLEVLQQFQTQFRNKYEYALTGAGSHKPGGAVQDDYLLPWQYLDDTLQRYQNPEEVDKILKIQKDIQETKTVMYNAIDQMLERGTTINDMVATSNDLSLASKTFYNQAKETNSGCCAVM